MISHTGWDYKLKAALGPKCKLSPSFEYVNHKAEKVLRSYMQALAFKQPSPLVLQSLLAAIKAGSVSAVETLLSCPDCLSATPSDPAAEPGAASEQIFAAIFAHIKTQGRQMVQALTAAFQQQHRQDLLLGTAAPALALDDKLLLQWQIRTTFSTWPRHGLSFSLWYAVRYGRLGALQQFLSIPGLPWQEVHLQQGMKVAAELGSTDAVQLLLDACPQWSTAVLAELLPGTTSPAVAEQLLGAAADGWEDWELRPVVGKLARAGNTTVLKVVLNPDFGAGWDAWNLEEGLDAAVVSNQGEALSCILASKSLRWQVQELTEEVVIAASSGNAAILQQLLDAIVVPDPGKDFIDGGEYTWKSEHLAAAVLEVSTLGKPPYVLLLLLKAAADGWHPSELLAALLEAVAGGSVCLLRELLQPCHLMAQCSWDQHNLHPVLDAAVGAGSVECLGEILAAAEVLGVEWEPQQLECTFLKAVSAGDGLSAELLQPLLDAVYHSLWDEQRIHLVPAISEAIRRRDSAAVRLLLAAPGGLGSWYPGELRVPLLAATAGGDQGMVQAVLAAGGDRWHPNDLAPSVEAAAWGGEGQQQLLKCLVAAAAGRWEPIHLEDVLMAAAAAGAGGGAMAEQGDAAACAVIEKLINIPLAKFGRRWESSQLAAPLHKVVQFGHVRLAGEILAAARRWTAAELLGCLDAAMQHTGGTALKLLQLILAAAQGQWLEEQLTPLLDAAVTASWLELFREVVRWKPVQGWTAKGLTKVLKAAVASSDLTYMESVLQLGPPGGWDYHSLQGALNAAIKQDSGVKVSVLLYPDGRLIKCKDRCWDRIVKRAEDGGNMAAAAALRVKPRPPHWMKPRVMFPQQVVPLLPAVAVEHAQAPLRCLAAGHGQLPPAAAQAAGAPGSAAPQQPLVGQVWYPFSESVPEVRRRTA